MAAYLVDILAVGFFIIERTVYAVTLERTAAVVIVTWRRQFASDAWSAMGS